MPLVLVTGPANAAKAGAVLDRFRALLPRDPLLVVPTAADVDHYARELAAGGSAFGGEVVTFARLAREIAARAGLPGRPLGPVARERLVRAVVRDARLRVLARPATSPGFAHAAGELFAELQRTLVSPARFAAALEAWGEQEPGRAAYASELGGLYGAYRERLERLGLRDAEGFAWAALDALRARPERWGRRPVLLYGFDDLTPLERDAVEALSARAEADVLLALPYEPGRAAFAGTAATVALLAPLADRHVELPDRSAHYASGSRPALHHLERRLFEPSGPRRSPNGAVRLLEAGGERAEAELVGAEVLELMREGMAPQDIAVLSRGGADLLRRVLASYGVPVAGARRVPLAATRLGAGVLAFARAGLPGGTPEDLLTWLRTPGKLARPEDADRFEARLRRGEVTEVRAARALWERESGARGPLARGAAVAGEGPDGPLAWGATVAASGPHAALAPLDALAGTAEEGPAALLAVLEQEAAAMWTAPHRRRAAVLGPEELADARVADALRGAAAELRGLAEADPELLADPRELLEALGAVRVREGEDDPLGVVLADPLAIRGRRFRAVFVCGLQAGGLPRAPVPDPFLPDEDRRALARASGLALPLREDSLARERSLFYACASRPEEVLFLSWRSSTEEGDPLLASPFVDDVRALFTEELDAQRGRRLLAEVTWAPHDAPTPHELRRALAARRGALPREPAPLGPPATEAVRASLAARRREPARGLETAAACGVRWLVDALLRPGRVDPDPDAMRRGALAHGVLERTLRGLRERTGSAAITPASLPRAEAELEVALAELGGRPRGARRRAVLHGLERDLRRYLCHEAEHGTGLEPARLEWRFGGEEDGAGPLELDGGLEVSGQVDRVDVDAAAGVAVVRDYKSRAAPAGARWADGQHLQVALYALAVRERLGLEPVAGLYQPLAGKDLRPRGIVREGVAGRYVDNDVLDEGRFDAALARAREAAERTAATIREAQLRPCPDRCTPQGGCAHPTICRAGSA
jgi:RecB family exonuclease